MSKSTLLQLDPKDGLKKWLLSWNIGKRVQGIVVHHTEDPDGAAYKGVSTVAAIRRYHMIERGWSDIGANLYSAPDGTVITGRPLDEANWSHAAVSRPWDEVEPEAAALCKGDRSWPNHYAIGIETIANFDDHDPWGTGPDAKSLQVTLDCCTTICQVYGLTPSRIIFHRDVADKTCPGTNLTRAMLRLEVTRRLKGLTMPDISEWAKAYVERAIGEGLMSKNAEGKFRGTEPLTREEAATALMRLLDKLRAEMGGTT